jgi:hypothetical protein
MRPGADPCLRRILAHLEHPISRLDTVTSAPPGYERARERCITEVGMGCEPRRPRLAHPICGPEPSIRLGNGPRRAILPVGATRHFKEHAPWGGADDVISVNATSVTADRYRRRDHRMRRWAAYLLGIAVSGAVALPDMAQQPACRRAHQLPRALRRRKKSPASVPVHDDLFHMNRREWRQGLQKWLRQRREASGVDPPDPLAKA